MSEPTAIRTQSRATHSGRTEHVADGLLHQPLQPRSALHALREAHALAPPRQPANSATYMPSSSRCSRSSRNWSNVRSSVAPLLAVMAAVPPDPFIAARSAARAAAGTGAGALHGGLILSSCAWIAAAFRLRACPRGASSPRQRCLAPPRHSPLPAHRRRRCAARTSRAALDGIEPDLARDPACTPKSEVTR